MIENKPIQILLVEDNALNQKLIIINLKKKGYLIDLAENGLEAIEKYKNNSYDLIIMDLMMPVMDGLEATKQIRLFENQNGTYTPIVGLTANTFDADRDKCLSIGMDEYMAKPFNLELFNSIVDKLNIV